MDPLTKAAFVVVALLFVGATWWYVHDEVKQRRRQRAEVWAQQQVSSAAPVAPEVAAPLDPLPDAEDDPPDLLRPYIWGHGDTEEIPKVRDLGREPPGS